MAPFCLKVVADDYDENRLLKLAQRFPTCLEKTVKETLPCWKNEILLASFFIIDYLFIQDIWLAHIATIRVIISWDTQGQVLV